MIKCIECNCEIKSHETYDIIEENYVHLQGCRSRYIRRLDDTNTSMIQLENFVLNE